MSIINCPECNTEVSSTAAKCPKCGYRINKPKRSIIGQFFKWIFIIFNVLMLIFTIKWLYSVGEMQTMAASQAELTGIQLGTGIGVYFVLFLWALGDIVFGALSFFTRARD